LLLNDFIQDISLNIKNGDILHKLLRDLNESLVKVTQRIEFCGRIWVDFSNLIKPLFSENFGEEFKLLPELAEAEINQKLKKIISDVNEHYKQKQIGGNLGDYSPWLRNFRRNLATDIEIPGN
jgi:hypothetical protein